MDLAVHVCDVRKPLLSVAAMNDQVLGVRFFADPKKGTMAVDPQSKQGLNIRRSNNVFELDATVLPWSGCQGQVFQP